jgi:small subunit ribosomal protein S6
MTRTYELGVVIEPRQSDEAAEAIIDRFKTMLEESGATIQYVDHWGKRKLAYPIRKYKEGRYYFVYVASDKSVPWVDVERLLMQDEKVLRHLWCAPTRT